MVDYTTGAMQEFGATARGPGTGPVAGLVLLYAESWPRLPAAFLFHKERQVIGREPGVELELDVPAVSRKHAEIGWANGAYHVRDLGSRNGVIVNGRRVPGVALDDCDELRIGDAIFKFVERDAEAFAGYRLDGSMARGHARRAAHPSLLVGGLQMDRIVAELERIAPTPLSVVLRGASGTGKEVVASELHRLSARPGRFGAVNCAAIPALLLESELFGFKRGAFSGADRDKPGLIRAADGGTLFLDEIGDMPLDAQAKLLRVLQSREVFPLGATTPERVDIRVVCATHRDLYQYVKEAKFRGDLLARLNEHVVRLPPLRERKEDIYLLARSFGERYGRPQLQYTFSFFVALLHYDWPFNVRELESCIKRGVALAGGGPLDTAQLPEAIAEHMAGYGHRARILAPSAPPPSFSRPGAAMALGTPESSGAIGAM